MAGDKDMKTVTMLYPLLSPLKPNEQGSYRDGFMRPKGKGAPSSVSKWGRKQAVGFPVYRGDHSDLLCKSEMSS